MTPSNQSGTMPIRVLYGAAVLAMLFNVIVLLAVLNRKSPRPDLDYGVPASIAFSILFAIGIGSARALSEQGKRIAKLEQELAELKNG